MRKFALSLITVFYTALPQAVFAFSVNDTGLRQTGARTYASTLNMDAGTFLGVFVMRPLFQIAGLIFLILIIYSGILWMTDRGDLDYVKKAKSILTNSVIGLILLMAAYAITDFVLINISNRTPAQSSQQSPPAP
jgi:hypothetical protein